MGDEIKHNLLPEISNRTFWKLVVKKKFNVCSFSLSKCKENLNITEASNFLVKHIIASENDILKSVVPDTISPQLNSDKEMTCSACFKPWEEVATKYGSSIGLKRM